MCPVFHPEKLSTSLANEGIFLLYFKNNRAYGTISQSATTSALGGKSEIDFFRMRLAVLVSMLVKHIQIQTDNVHSSLGSAHCSCEKSIDLHLLKSAFIPFYETLVRPHQEYGMPSCSASLIVDSAN